MRIILTIFLIAALVRCDDGSLNEKYPQLCNDDQFFKQGTYQCILGSREPRFFQPQIQKRYYVADSILSECQNSSFFYDTELSECVAECKAPKIKNFINGSCETKEKILKEIKHLAIFTFDEENVFSEKQMSFLIYKNKNFFNYPCPLIDLTTRTCLESIEDCTGVIVNRIYCKKCDCSKSNNDEELCKLKCSCNNLFFQNFYPNHEFLCEENCHKNQGNLPYPNLVQYGDLCIPQSKCPFIVVDNQTCLKTCAPMQKENPRVVNFIERCTDCKRIGQNQLCSDECPNFNEILIQNQDNQSFQCVDLKEHPELALKSEGCMYPLVLSADGSTCLIECPPGQKHVHLRNSDLSKCIISDECDYGYFESSNGKECVDFCGKLFEIQFRGQDKCFKCEEDTTLFYNKEEQYYECRSFNTLNDDAETLERLLLDLSTNDIIQFLEKIGENIKLTYNYIRDMTEKAYSDRFYKYSHFLSYFHAASLYHNFRQHLLISTESSFYYDVSHSSGFGIEEMKEGDEIYESYYSLENIVEGVHSVRFEIILRKLINQVKEYIIRFDKAQFCFGDDEKPLCKETSMFFNGNYKFTLKPIFKVDSSVITGVHKLYCVSENFYSEKNFLISYKLTLSLTEQINENEVSCPSFELGGVGLIALSEDEAQTFQSFLQQSQPQVFPWINYGEFVRN